MLEVFLPLITELLSQLFYLIGVLAIGFIIAFIRKRSTNEEQKLIEEIFKDGILFAQQVYGHLDGDKRFEEAKATIIELLAHKGINIDETKIRPLIESNLKKLKKEFGEQWKQ